MEWESSSHGEERRGEAASDADAADVNTDDGCRGGDDDDGPTAVAVSCGNGGRIATVGPMMIGR